jgi:hypothetical protein
VARNLVREDLDMQLIVRASGLSEKEVLELRDEWNEVTLLFCLPLGK